MKYKNHLIVRVDDEFVYGGKYYVIYKLDRVINRIDFSYKNVQYYVDRYNHVYHKRKVTCAWTISNAKEFINTFDGENYQWNVLC